MASLEYMVFGIAVGILVGLWPLIKGVKADQVPLALGGFFASALAGAVLGLILCIPIAWVFVWSIRKRSQPEQDSLEEVTHD